MTKAIRIEIGSLKAKAELNNSKTALGIYEKLPLEANVQLWGEEVYFDIPVKMGLEKEFSREIVELGDLGYWPAGQCFCIFFGLTPDSKKGQIRPASAVNVIGKISAGLEGFKQVKEGETIILQKEETK